MFLENAQCLCRRKCCNFYVPRLCLFTGWRPTSSPWVKLQSWRSQQSGRSWRFQRRSNTDQKMSPREKGSSRVFSQASVGEVYLNRSLSYVVTSSHSAPSEVKGGCPIGRCILYKAVSNLVVAMATTFAKGLTKDALHFNICWHSDPAIAIAAN